MTPEQLQQLTPWLHFVNGNTYTIYLEVKPRAAEEPSSAAPERGQPYVYSAVVQLQRGYAMPPKVLLVDPYARLPADVAEATAPAQDAKAKQDKPAAGS